MILKRSLFCLLLCVVPLKSVRADVAVSPARTTLWSHSTYTALDGAQEAATSWTEKFVENDLFPPERARFIAIPGISATECDIMRLGYRSHGNRITVSQTFSMIDVEFDNVKPSVGNLLSLKELQMLFQNSVVTATHDPITFTVAGNNTNNDAMEGGAFSKFGAADRCWWQRVGSAGFYIFKPMEFHPTGPSLTFNKCWFYGLNPNSDPKPFIRQWTRLMATDTSAYQQLKSSPLPQAGSLTSLGRPQLLKDILTGPCLPPENLDYVYCPARHPDEIDTLKMEYSWDKVENGKSITYKIVGIEVTEDGLAITVRKPYVLSRLLLAPETNIVVQNPREEARQDAEEIARQLFQTADKIELISQKVDVTIFHGAVAPRQAPVTDWRRAVTWNR